MKKRCSKCGEIKLFTDFYKLSTSSDGVRPECKECHLKQKDQYIKDNLVDYTIRKLANCMANRLFRDIDKPKNKCYIGVKSYIGNTYEEIYHTLNSKFRTDVEQILSQGKTPSIDRIDSNKHYSIDNIKVIDLKENYMKGLANAVSKISKPIKVIYPDGFEKEFDSISSASRELKIKRDTIYSHLDGSSTRKGFRFKLIAEEFNT